MTITEGTLLGGRVRYHQFATGHRSGFEPVLLAAAAPARAGEAVVEFGTGAGAALLCLAHRVPGVTGIGLEIDPAVVALANENFRVNGLDRLVAVEGDARAPALAARFDHAISNPPWHDAAGTKSPDSGRALAHHASEALMADWIAGMAKVLKPNGFLTLIVPGAAFSRAAAAMRDRGVGAIRLLPLWQRAGRAAGTIILMGRRGAKGGDSVLPGLVLHDKAGITPAADEVLRGGAGLSHQFKP